MDTKTLRATIDFFCRDKKYVEFIWHGGEPLLAQIDFYRDVVKHQQSWVGKGVKVVNFIQTNATLVTEEWARFFARHNFLVGVSIDGNRDAHDKNRRYRSGCGSFNEVMRGVELLRNAHVFNGAICGISTENYSSPKEIFEFFLSHGIKKLKFARVKDIGQCNDLSTITIPFGKYIDFMTTIFDLWVAVDDPEIEIRDIQSVVNILMGGTFRECIYMGKCDNFVTVYHDGSIYSCDSFPKKESLRFGNVFEEPSKIMTNPNLKTFQEMVGTRDKYCRSCSWYFICKGGCAKDHYSKIDSFEPIKEHCEELKRYFYYISTKLRNYNLI